jgi:hypothetical protein
VDPLPVPPEVTAVWERFLTAEYASLTRTGLPVTVPVTPYVGEEGRTLDLSTGLTYPAKAERARRDPRVCLLFADPVGAGLDDPPVVLVQGLATVRDSDLQANTDRYVRVSTAKLPAATKGQPRFVLRRMAWYFARIWIEITPLHVFWWSGRALDCGPDSWHAPEGSAAPLSDPAPSGAQPPAWLRPPPSWRTGVEAACRRLPLHDLTVVDANGFPLCLPLSRTTLVADGFELELGPGAPVLADGPACLTMHAHPEVFTNQENHTFVGRLTTATSADDGTRRARMAVDRALADWSMVGNKAISSIGFLRKGRLLRPRLETEARRRSQSVPKVNFPPPA